MSTYLALAAIAVMLLAAALAALFGRSHGARVTGVAVLVAVMAVLAVLSLVAHRYLPAALLGAGVAVTVHLAVAAAFHTPTAPTRSEAEEAVR